jgi:hypothetical protein
MNTHDFAIVQAIAYDRTLDFKKFCFEFFSTLDQSHLNLLSSSIASQFLILICDETL